MCYCPTPTLHLTLPLTGNFLHFYFFKKNIYSVWFISLLKYGDMGKCPHKSPSPCNTYVIAMSLYKFVSSSYVTKTRTHMYICIHTHKYFIIINYHWNFIFKLYPPWLWHFYTELIQYVVFCFPTRRIRDITHLSLSNVCLPHSLSV